MRLKFGLLVFLSLAPCASRAWAQTVTLENHDTSWVTGMEGGTGNYNPVSTTASVPVNVHQAGDLIFVIAWCYYDCTVSSLSIDLGGGQSLSVANGGLQQTTVQGVSSQDYGQARFFYVPSAPAGMVGAPHTLTFVRSGGTSAPGTAVEHQIAYLDFSVTGNYHFVHHIDTALATGTNTATAPSITAPGDLVVNFTWVSGHAGPYYSPWLFTTWGPDQFQELTNSINAVAYLPSAPAGAVANHIGMSHPTDTWAAMFSSFTPTPNGTSAPAPPSGLSTKVN